MKREIKLLIIKLPFYPLVHSWLFKYRENRKLRKRQATKTPALIPLHLDKQRILKQYAHDYDLKVMVETGTCYGDMVDAMQDRFDRIYSIELSRDLYNFCKRRFRSAKNVELVLGNSGEQLGNVVPKITKPTLFWLDGHYSGGETAQGDKDTPIFDELSHVLSFPAQEPIVILIDDAIAFGRDPAYPTIEQLKTYILSKRPNVDINIEQNVIRVTPAKAA